MLFNSWQFLFVFLPILLVSIALMTVPLLETKKWLLIAASFVFYAFAGVKDLPLLLGSLFLNGIIALGMHRAKAGWIAISLLVLGVAANLGALAYYKYAPLLIALLPETAGSSQGFGLGAQKLPLAISFLTFTQIGYLIDTYRKRTTTSNPTDYCLFVVFFPHLIAGPIIRRDEIIPQFATTQGLQVTLNNLSIGTAWLIIGIFKKVLCADLVAPTANAVFAAADYSQLGPADAWLGVLAFSLQIYFDFSGYTDMAIGLARMFGIRFPQNFNAPYKATSVSDFWHRWHMSLGRFLRDYLYIPLGGSRCDQFRQTINVMVTMIISGLWHGAGATFVLWAPSMAHASPCSA